MPWGALSLCNTAGLQENLWQGDRSYANCLRAVYAAKQKAFPKGSVRRGKCQSLGSVATPFGLIELSVFKNDEADLFVEHNRYCGLLHHNGSESVEGRCFFSTYRPVRGSGWLSDGDLFYSMDAMSQEACDWHGILSRADDGNYEVRINLEGILTADEIWMSPELRGAAAWKILYFSTMSVVFAHQRKMYTDFAFKAHPLMRHNDPARPSKAELQRQSMLLRRFYAVHLGAKVIRHDGEPTEYMRAEVPDALFSAWHEVTRSGRSSNLPSAFAPGIVAAE